jgi:predicted unusual protein kinase regulating ubiquinone biosynthesis (AarF/ABC1/UbiB family)
MSPEAAASVVTAELGAPPEKVFLDWAADPVAAASIGQVHRAVTRHGDDVAVKVQYPGIKDVVRADLQNVGMVLKLLGRIAPGAKADAAPPRQVAVTSRPGVGQGQRPVRLRQARFRSSVGLA